MSTDAPQARAGLREIQGWLWSAAIVAAVWGVFADVVEYPPVRLDDEQHVFTNNVVRQGLTAEGIRWACGYRYANWHPLTWMSYMLDVELHGISGPGFHVTSLVLHAAGSLLWFHVLRAATGATVPSAVVALLFAVHPLHVESAAWIAGRKDLLANLFVVLSLGAWIRFVRNGSRAAYAGSLVLFAASLMSKQSTVPWPAVLLLLDLWPLGRLRLGRFGADGPAMPDADPLPPVGRKRLVLEKLPFFALAIGAAWLGMQAQLKDGTVTPLGAMTAFERLRFVVETYGIYLRKTVWPNDLSAFCPIRWEGGTWTEFAASAVVVGGTSIASVLAVRRCGALFVGWWWFVGMLVPTTVLALGQYQMADRYTYIPLVGLFAAATWTVVRTTAGSRRAQRASFAAAACAVVAFAVAAKDQVATWRSHQAMTEQIVRANSAEALLNSRIGSAFLFDVRPQAAIDFLTGELQRGHDTHYLRQALAVALARLGRILEAAPHLEAAVRFAPRDEVTWDQYGHVLLDSCRYAEAREALRQALKIDPALRAARVRLSVVQLLAEDYAGAAQTCKELLEADPGNPEFLGRLATALAKSGDVATAETIRRELPMLAARRKPGLRAAALAEAGRLVDRNALAEALEGYRNLLMDDPDDVAAHLALVAALDRAELAGPAEYHLRRAVRLAPDRWESRVDLAERLARRGARDEALEQAREAAQIRPDSERVRRLVARLESGPASPQKDDLPRTP